MHSTSANYFYNLHMEISPKFIFSTLQLRQYSWSHKLAYFSLSQPLRAAMKQCCTKFDVSLSNGNEEQVTLTMWIASVQHYVSCAASTTSTADHDDYDDCDNNKKSQKKACLLMQM